MNKLICYTVNKHIDGYIASRFGWKPEYKERGMSPYTIASLRGVYDQYHPENHLLDDNKTEFTDEELEEAYKKLAEFRRVINSTTRQKLAGNLKRMNEAFDSLRHAFTVEQRKSRISYLTAAFSSEVDRLMRGNNFDRDNLINGFYTTSGEYVGGPLAIFSSVYNHIAYLRQNYYSRYKNAELGFNKDKDKLNFAFAPTNVDEYRTLMKERYEAYSSILEHWEELLPFVFKNLMVTEGLKMGIKNEYATAASTDSFGENDIAAKWEISESKRDGWQENSDLQSAFGSVGKQVRRVLATCPELVPVPVEDAAGNVVRIEYKIAYDDLGNVKFRDPVETHQAIIEMLRGVQNSDDMYKRLVKEGTNNAKIPWMQPVVNLLSDPTVRTQFFVDFRRVFQPYSASFEDKESSSSFVKKVKTRILNRPTNMLLGKFKTLMSKKGVLPKSVRMWKTETVFKQGKEGGTINWGRLVEVKKAVQKWVVADKNKGIFSEAPLTDRGEGVTINIDGKSQEVTHDLKRKFLMEVFTSFGFDVLPDTVESILLSPDIYEVRRQLERLFSDNGGIKFAMNGIGEIATEHYGKIKISDKYGTLSNPSKSKEDKEAAAKALDEAKLTMQKLYGTKRNDGYPVADCIEKLLNIINKHQEGYRVESRVRYMDNTLYSFVSPSYLGDRLEAIEAYVNNNDKAGLKSFLEKEYLRSPYFVDDECLVNGPGDNGKGILNMWVRELYAACQNNNVPLSDSVASIFSFERNLGSDIKKFEDFTAREHGVDMLIHFFADEQQGKTFGGRGKKDLNRRLSALFPVFVLGDAGVSKYIRAPRITSPHSVDAEGNKTIEEDKIKGVAFEFDNYAKRDVLENFYNVFTQEMRRMDLDKIIAKSYTLYANGKAVEHGEREFSILTFLNPTSQEYKPEYNPFNADGTAKSKDEIMDIINKYLNDATERFNNRLEKLGVLDTTTVGNTQVLRHLSSIANPGNIDSKIEEFFWNTKLATIQQLQMMTIDPAFYANTKDLQKRYKEIHAPGSILDVRAIDIYAPNAGTRYSDGIERVVYFDDLSLNAEVFNPEFMEAILRNFAAPGVTKEDIDKAVADNILSPRDSKEEETKRINKLSELLGSNYKIYDVYMKNSLTDGQGYRTLHSYRKVMGMAGKWTPEMQSAYETIMNIRNTHAIWENGKIVDYSELTDEEMKQLGNLAVIFQPIKPYMFTHETIPVEVNLKKDGKTVVGLDGKPVTKKTVHYIPVQHKYAEAVIIPELLPKGHKLRDLGHWMDENNVDMIGSTKIAKVGAYGQANFSDVKDKADLYGRLNNSSVVIHSLDYSDYRIQTNVPEHINSSQLFGTQIRKLIMAGLKDSKDYSDYINGHVVNLEAGDGRNTETRLLGNNLLAFYNSLHTANIMDSYNIFANNATDIIKMAELLQQSTVTSMREAMDNILSYVVTGSEKELQKFLIPLFEGGLEHDSAALILSTFKKIVNKQQISGGSAVQVSAFGIQGYERDGDLRYVTDPDNAANVLYAEVEMPFDKSITVDVATKDGTVKKPVSLNYDKYCFPDGHLRPTDKALEKGTKEWKKYQSYTYKRVDGKLVPCKYNDPQAEVHKPLIEEEYPDCLSFIAYRIPTERAYSMMNCQIKRFTSKVAGGTIKVPAQGTTIAGFDFDIDKLYFMLREYHKHYKSEMYVENNFSNKDKQDIWNTVYEKYPDVKVALIAARSTAEFQNPELTTDESKRPALNSYWEAADIEARFGLNKRTAFAEAALELNIKPTKNVVTGETSEWLETYDFSKTPEENTRASRNNMLISLIQARLMDADTMNARYTPGGFDNASRAARFMRELMHGDMEGVTKTNGSQYTAIYIDEILKRYDDKKAQDPEPNYDPSDPYTILYYNQQNQIAGKLIGIFANQNTNHAFVSAMELFELKEPIEFCGHKFKDLLHKNTPMAAEIDTNMANFLGAAVDAVKDPTLNFLNLNTVTADAGAMLARLGYNLREIGLLFNQPVIRKACEEALNRGIKVNTVIDELVDDLKGNIEGQYNNDTSNLSEENLALAILNERRFLEEDEKNTRDQYIKNNAKMQIDVLELFGKIISAANDVSQFVLNTKFTASNAVSSTFGGMYAQQLRVDEYLKKFPKDSKNNSKDKKELSYNARVSKQLSDTYPGFFDSPISNNETLLKLVSTEGKTPEQIKEDRKKYLKLVRFNPFAYEQAMYDANRAAIKTLGKYYPYETELYRKIRKKMQNLAAFGTLSEDEINDIHGDLCIALLASQSASYFNGEALYRPNSTLTNREYYREKFAGKLADMIAKDPDGLGSLEVFKYITPSVEVVAQPKKKGVAQPSIEVWSLRVQDVGGLSTDIKEAIRESWASLMERDADGDFVNPDYAELGKDLFMYCFYQLGFDFSPLSFMHLAPTDVKNNIIVERSDMLPLEAFDKINPPRQNSPSDDVLVWSEGVTGGKDRVLEFGEYAINDNVLFRNAYKLPTNLVGNYTAVIQLIQTAKNHPELTFKIDRQLTQEEFDMFTKDSQVEGVPSNIKFSQATLDNVSQESKEKIEYGRYRTYREFLNEILDDKIDMNADDFAQMFILNHLDYPRFTLDTNKTHKNLRKLIQKKAGVTAETRRMPDTIEIDISGENKEVIKNLASVEKTNGEITKVTWRPCIKVNNTYYLAQGNGGSFNETTNPTITYVKIEPKGTKKALKYDDGQTLKPSLRYSTSVGQLLTVSTKMGNTPQETQEESTPDNTPAPDNTTTGQQLVDDNMRPEEPIAADNGNTSNLGELRGTLETGVINEYVRAIEMRNNGISEAERQSVKQAITNLSDDDLLSEINLIRNAYRKNGVMVLDEEGNPVKSC